MNEALTNFHFIRPAWLLLLPLAVVLWWRWQRHADPLRGWRAQMDPELLEALTMGRESTRRGPVRLLLIGWILAALAIAGPTWRLEPSPFTDGSSPLMIVLKADLSMDTTDPAPSRMERAQLKIADLAAAREGQPLGLIAYAGSAHLVLPPTRDTAVVAQMAAEISPAIMPSPGDRLDLALIKAGEILNAEGLGGRILVIADSVGGDPATVKSAHQTADRPPVHFLTVNVPDSSDMDSVRSMARNLSATVQQLTADDSDIQAITRATASAPMRSVGNADARWQEAGFWLTPVLAFLVASSFRRSSGKPTASS